MYACTSVYIYLLEYKSYVLVYFVLKHACFMVDFVNPVQVIQGLLQAHESVIVSKDNVAQLFAHEATRVFHDRLICAEDRDIFFQFLSDTLHDHFKVIYL